MLRAPVPLGPSLSLPDESPAPRIVWYVVVFGVSGRTVYPGQASRCQIISRACACHMLRLGRACRCQMKARLHGLCGISCLRFRGYLDGHPGRASLRHMIPRACTGPDVRCRQAGAPIDRLAYEWLYHREDFLPLEQSPIGNDELFLSNIF
jgi:hypothetical protein